MDTSEPNAIALTVSQQFEIERFNRIIDETTDRDALRKTAKQLLTAWQYQKAATLWAMREALPPPLKLSNDKARFGILLWISSSIFWLVTSLSISAVLAERIRSLRLTTSSRLKYTSTKKSTH
jgi:hypothetical protein